MTEKKTVESTVRESRFPASLFFVYLIVLLLIVLRILILVILSILLLTVLRILVVLILHDRSPFLRR